ARHRHDEICGEVGDHAAVAAEAAARLVAQTKPVDRKVFDEAAKLERGVDIAKAIKCGVAALISRRHELGDGTRPQVTEIDQRDAGIVAWTVKTVRRAGAAA